MKRLFTLLFLILTVPAWAQSNIQRLAQAIAKAEGFYTKGTIPQRCFNPGDIKAVHGWTYPGHVGVCKGGLIRFKNATYGWQALYGQLEKVAARESKVYTPEMTLNQAAHKYAGDWRTWARNVAHNINVTPGTTLAELLDVPPAVVVKYDTHELDLILARN